MVARIDGTAITAGDLLDELRMRRGPAVLVDLIDTQLIHQAAAAADLTASDDEMDLRWQRAMAEAGSEADMLAILQRRNVSSEQYREQLRTDLLLDKLARAAMTIADQEVADFYREHQEDYRLGERMKGRLILVGSKEDAEAIDETLKAGGDFEGLAQALSIDSATAEQGGDMGWFQRDDYTRAITDVAFEMEPGQVSGPIEVPDGWAILKIEDRAGAGYRPLEEARDEIQARIVRAKLPYARADWIHEARRGAAIRINDENLREATLEMLQSAPPPQSPSLLPVPPPQ